MSALVFLDTETTGLGLDADIWEFAGIRRAEDGTETSLHLFIDHDWQKCRSLPKRFRDDHLARFPGHEQATSRHDAAWSIYRFITGGLLADAGVTHVAGAVPNFDTERLARMFHAVINQDEPPWHYHLIDVENLAAGWLAAQGIATPLPWDSDTLSRSVGVKPPTVGRHTAMGDAEWARAIYDAVMGGAK